MFLFRSYFGAALVGFFGCAILMSLFYVGLFEFSMDEFLWQIVVVLAVVDVLIIVLCVVATFGQMVAPGSRAVASCRSVFDGCGTLPAAILLILTGVFVHVVCGKFEDMFVEMQIPLPAVTRLVFVVGRYGLVWIWLSVPLYMLMRRWRSQGDDYNIRAVNATGVLLFHSAIVFLAYALYLPFVNFCHNIQ